MKFASFPTQSHAEVHFTTNLAINYNTADPRSSSSIFIDKHFIHLNTWNIKNLKTELCTKVTWDKSKLREIIHIFHYHVEIKKSVSIDVVMS